MTAKNQFSEGDTLAMQGEVTLVHDNGKEVTVHFPGYDIPVTIRAEHLSLVAKKKPSKSLHDKW